MLDNRPGHRHIWHCNGRPSCRHHWATAGHRHICHHASHPGHWCGTWKTDVVQRTTEIWHSLKPLETTNSFGVAIFRMKIGGKSPQKVPWSTAFPKPLQLLFILWQQAGHLLQSLHTFRPRMCQRPNSWQFGAVSSQQLRMSIWPHICSCHTMKLL